MQNYKSYDTVALDKVERIENINTDNLTINSGTFTIKCGSNQSVEIETADDVLIQATGQSQICIDSVENLDGHKL